MARVSQITWQREMLLALSPLPLGSSLASSFYRPGTPHDGYLKPSAVSGPRSTTGARFVPALNVIEPGVR